MSSSTSGRPRRVRNLSVPSAGDHPAACWSPVAVASPGLVKLKGG
jgi:hypothetical protein